MSKLIEEQKRKLRELTKQYIYRNPEDPSHKEFHYHLCRVCQEEQECYVDDCEFARVTICHNCYYDLEDGKI